VDSQEGIQDAEKQDARWHGCWMLQKASLEVLPAENGSYSHWTVLTLG